MTREELADLSKLASTLSDEDLEKAVTVDAGDYDPQAIAVFRAEIDRRKSPACGQSAAMPPTGGPAESEPAVKSGVGGWLLYFCIGMIVAGLIEACNGLVLLLRGNQVVFPLMPGLPQTSQLQVPGTAVVVIGATGLAFGFLGICAAILLVGVRCHEVLRGVKAYLWARVAWAFLPVILALTVPNQVEPLGLSVSESVLDAVFSLFYPVILLRYFSSSERVRATYL